MHKSLKLLESWMVGVESDLKDPLIQPQFHGPTFYNSRLLKSPSQLALNSPRWFIEQTQQCHNGNLSWFIHVKFKLLFPPPSKPPVITGVSAVCKILHFLILELPLKAASFWAERLSTQNTSKGVLLGCRTSQWAFPGHALHALSCSAGNSASTAACQSKSS